ncbi:hypothetical protein JN11_01432 [Mucilaginibacter frigoritolerans]|uniref:Uncharacterized protein n=1 Tax=Mucilaginibacter frigoritolerans TaxID=652788 RepID=A0A562UA28_9SPHI|nr:hypothetical protein [Mucilaginibacter frigoritolerans]TWJ02459.1 hypothetical protein JN11_01432 [Mucilaginibacter frigoritolerans]
MNELTISKTPALTNDQDYAFLLQAGLTYIEQLGSDTWTDYNEHDPGVTILEALCYAITELGYRSGLPVQDLLTEQNGTISSSQTLYTAKTILTQAPLNIDDYRKLLIDIIGVHNAWLLPESHYVLNDRNKTTGEVAIFADCTTDSLVYTNTPHAIYLSGLYRVLLDLDNDDQLGDLNNGELQVLNPGNSSFASGAVSLTVAFPAWNDSSVNTLLGADLTSVSNISTTFASGADLTITINFAYLSGGQNTTIALTGTVSVDLQPAGKTLANTDIEQFFDTAFTAQVINLYLLKIQKTNSIVQIATATLNQNRNLCEDFVSITTITDEEIAICCDIDVTPSADMEQIQAQVFYAIEEYFDPSVNFYLLSDMQAKDYTTDEIFEGPALQHGFIDTTELEQTQLREEIYASEIISLIMNIDGVLAARNFRMTKYDAQDNPISTETGKQWCMPISSGCKPVLADTKSKILFYKNQFPYTASLADVRSILQWMNAIKAKNKLAGHTDDIPVPGGTYYPLDSYTSVQDLLPATYGIGNAGLPVNSTNQRMGQANQLRAYMLLYDQLLADFFSQLKNAKELFSTDTTVQTYYAQFLGEIKDVLPVYKAISPGNIINELVMTAQDATVTPPNPWQALYETNEVFLDRRNRFLDHLMSRFAESFNQYVLLMYSLDYTTQQESGIDPSDLIKSKIQFLQNYPGVSYQRGQAYNYCPLKTDLSVDTSQLWDTGNVSGAEKKLSSLGGFSNFYRRFLYCIGTSTIITTNDTPAKYQFQFSDGQGNTLTSITTYATQDDLNAALPAFMDQVLSGEYYNITQTGSNWNIYVTDTLGNNLAISNNFLSQDIANTVLTQFITQFSNECDAEGMHLIEHILLRPRNNTFALAPVCLDANCNFCGEQDPYSFRISVVLPYWPAHFQSMAFRSYFEDIIRQELPAHTIVKICWVGDAMMYDFENKYKTWITTLATYKANPVTANLTSLQTVNDSLLATLFTLYSQYPVATLHDCAESVNTNPVMLGKTILGSLNN